MTTLRAAFATMPWWFMGLGGGVSLYHGYRGYVLQRAFANYQQQTLFGPTYRLSPRQTMVTRSMYDGLFYAVCSMAGFAALWLAIYLFNTAPNIHDISGGASALLVFLFLLGLLGVSGQLSTVIQQGKFPK